jgi:hypothetical protein
MGDPYAGLRRHVENGVQAVTVTRPVRPERHSATGEAHGTHTNPDSVARGENHARAKFTDADIAAMRAAYEAGEPISAIAHRFKASRSHAGRIIRGQSRA